MDAFEIFRPFVFLAAIAFLIGFLGYAALAPRPAEAQRLAAPATGPITSPWVFEKRI